MSPLDDALRLNRLLTLLPAPTSLLVGKRTNRVGQGGKAENTE